MFQLYYDTRAEALAETLARLLAQGGADNPLLPRTVLVPQLGLERWLTRTLAERHGIAANIDFIAPAQFAWRLLRAWKPDLASRSPFDREVLMWRLYELLPQIAQQDANLEALLTGQQPSLRRLQLARQLAHLFERYQAYRPDVLEGWARGEDGVGSQAHLWRALTGSAREAPRSRLMSDFIRSFGADGAAAPPGLPAQVFAWGCINVSPLVLDLLRVVARHAELHFLMPTPCGEYWGDLPHRRDLAGSLDEFADGFMDNEPPNRLLVSMGGVGREFVARVFTDDSVQIESADGAAGEPVRDTVLQRVQADIITLESPDEAARLRAPDPADRSIQVQICHSPLREVQVLHDHLLDMLARDPELEPRDIVVMMPNVDRYAAAVEAVFGALEPNDPRYLPWTVADRAAANAHPVTAWFTGLLNLPAERLGLDRVLQMLEVPAVRQGMQLEGDSLEDLRTMAFEAGIRWGEDAGDREREGLPAFDDFSFGFGRRRLLLGYLLGEEDEHGLVRGIAPIADIEGERAHAFGALTRLERQVHELQQTMRTARTPLQWQTLFNAFLARVLQVDDDDQEAARALADVRQALASLVEDSAAADFDEPVDWVCVRELLGTRLEDSRPGQRFLDGGVSVCSMVPMRDVPFRVVCVLGLDADSFPRRDEADALSLIRDDAEHGRRRLGDRSVREDDRYLFLQTLMAARDRLYLSYPGVDLKSGKAREPSVLLAEFIEHVCQGYFGEPEEARKTLVTQQPMHPFSPRLFGAGNNSSAQCFTYRDEWRDAAASGMGSEPVPSFVNCDWPMAEVGERIELAALKRFFAAPQRTFLRQQPNLAIADIEAEIGREPLVLDRLQESWLQRTLLDRLLNAGDEDQAADIAALRARALLPPLAVGTQAYAEQRQVMAPQTASWRAWAGGAEPRGEHREFELDLGASGVLHGTIGGVLEHGFAGWVGRAGSVRRWINWWLDALVYRAALDTEGECRAFGINKDNAKPELPVSVAMPDRAVARAELARLVGLMRAGLSTPLLLPPRSGWVLAEKLVRGKRGQLDVSWAFEQAAKAWQDGDWPENRDAWIATVLRGREPFADPHDETGQACRELAELMYVPVWRTLLGKDAHGNA